MYILFSSIFLHISCNRLSVEVHRTESLYLLEDSTAETWQAQFLRTYSFLLSKADNHGLIVIYLQQDTTFSARGQKLFYPRSEVFLLANRNISIRSQKNLYFYRNRENAL